MNPLEWTQERVEVTDFPAKVNAEGLLTAGNETEPMLLLYYTVRIAPMNGDCLAGWRFEVVEPRELFAVNGTVQKVFEGIWPNVKDYMFLGKRPSNPASTSSSSAR